MRKRSVSVIASHRRWRGNLSLSDFGCFHWRATWSPLRTTSINVCRDGHLPPAGDQWSPLHITSVNINACRGNTDWTFLDNSALKASVPSPSLAYSIFKSRCLRKNSAHPNGRAEFLVREAGLEPARPEWTLEPESSESANSTTRAYI